MNGSDFAAEIAWLERFDFPAPPRRDHPPHPRHARTIASFLGAQPPLKLSALRPNRGRHCERSEATQGPRGGRGADGFVAALLAMTSPWHCGAAYRAATPSRIVSTTCRLARSKASSVRGPFSRVAISWAALA